MGVSVAYADALTNSAMTRVMSAPIVTVRVAVSHPPVATAAGVCCAELYPTAVQRCMTSWNWSPTGGLIFAGTVVDLAGVTGVCMSLFADDMESDECTIFKLADPANFSAVSLLMTAPPLPIQLAVSLSKSPLASRFGSSGSTHGALSAAKGCPAINVDVRDFIGEC